MRVTFGWILKVDVRRCAGYLFQRVGKIAATAVGGGFLLLQASAKPSHTLPCPVTPALANVPAVQADCQLVSGP